MKRILALRSTANGGEENRLRAAGAPRIEGAPMNEPLLMQQLKDFSTEIEASVKSRSTGGMHKPIQNTRWACPHCGAEGWDCVGQKISGRFDHDRYDGRRCRRAEGDLRIDAATEPKKE